MASGAQLNRWGEQGGVQIVRTSGTVTSGFIGTDAMAFSKWLFQIVPDYTTSTSVSGFSVVIQGTIDPLVYKLHLAWVKGKSVTIGGTTYAGDALLTALPNASWVDIVAPSTEGSDGGTPDDNQQYWNPLTSTGQFLYTPVPIIAVRAIVTATDPTGDLIVLGFAVP